MLKNELSVIIEVIPLLIAERIQNGKIDVFDLDLEKFISFEFKRSRVNESIIRQTIDFCIKIGMDTNARKNRSGDIFEKMCQQKIKKLIGSKYSCINNDTRFSLYSVVTKGKSKGKTHDIVIYEKGKVIMVVECNFYNVPGSKPISIAESYIEMNRVAKEHNIKFLWVTDGPAWHKMKEPLLRTMEKIDWLLNYRIIYKLPNT